MAWFDQFARNLGSANAPFGFGLTPGIAPSQDDPAYSAGMGMIGDIGMRMLASGSNRPLEAFGQAYIGAKDNARQQNKEAFAAQQLMAEAEENRRKREEEAERSQRWEQFISTLPAEQQPLARMFPERFGQGLVDAQFQTADAGSEQYFGTPIPFDMGNGQIGYGLPSKSGGFKPLDAPNGAAFLGPYDKAYQTSSGTARGKITTEQELSAPSDLAAAQQALDLLTQIENHPYIDRGTGFSSYGNVVAGTGGRDFQNLVEQAKSGAFLTAIDQLKGMGALSNMEGQAATAAVTRMDTATSKEAFLKAVSDYRKIVEAGAGRAMSRMGGAVPAPSPQTPQTRYKFNPETGELEE